MVLPVGISGHEGSLMTCWNKLGQVLLILVTYKVFTYALLHSL